MPMDWPDAASDAFSGLPDEHRIYSWYFALVVAAVAVLRLIERWTGGGSKPATSMTQADIEAVFRKCLNGDLKHHEERIMAAIEEVNRRIDHLAESSATKHEATIQRIATLEERTSGRRPPWDGSDRRRNPQ